MSANLRKIRLGDIRPNPFRDIEHYPIDRVKVELLRQSFERTGFWSGYMVVRESERGYEQAFGHHRVVAAKELWGEDHEIEVTVADLSDDLMLAMMAHENNERFAQYFYLAVMEPIEAVVKAYAAGRVELPTPDAKAPVSSLRNAPSYVIGGAQQHPYTATTVAAFLGWTQKRGSGTQAADRVHIALSALELIERKVLTRAQFLALTTTQAKALVDVTRGVIKAKEASLDADMSVHEQAAKKAEREGNQRKADEHRAVVDRLEETSSEQIAKAAKSTAAQVAHRLAGGEPVKTVLADTAEHVTRAETGKVKASAERVSNAAYSVEEVEALARKLDRLLLMEERGRAVRCRSEKAKSALDIAVGQLEMRCREWKKERK